MSLILLKLIALRSIVGVSVSEIAAVLAVVSVVTTVAISAVIAVAVVGAVASADCRSITWLEDGEVSGKKAAEEGEDKDEDEDPPIMASSFSVQDFTRE